MTQGKLTWGITSEGKWFSPLVRGISSKNGGGKFKRPENTVFFKNGLSVLRNGFIKNSSDGHVVKEPPPPGL